MEKQHSLDQLLLQVSEILEMIQNHKGTISQNLNPVILEQLDQIEEAIAILSHNQKETFKEARIDVDLVMQETMESPETKSKDKQLLKRAQEIEREAKAFHLTLSKALQRKKREKGTKSSTKENPHKQQIKERRKLFKPLGGDKSWIPL